MNFNKLQDTDFPHLDTVDVYALKNDFDFSRFDNAQMTIHVLNVPWDMGEAHVGQRTITGIGNVVKFENDAARDAWFKSKKYAETPAQWVSGEFDGFKWVTKFRHFHNGDDLKIPLPFDVVARFNYAFITYEPAPNENAPVDYEYKGLLTWFYFIRNFQMLSVNTTSCVVKRDTWQTYINHIQFKGMMLEQGHYPIAKSNVDTYLSNPIENNSGLLEEDIVYGELSQVKYNSAIVLNKDNMKAVIVSSANPNGNFGSKASSTWQTPTAYRAQDGQPSYFAIAIEPGDLYTFITKANANAPQFIQTIQAVFFISSNLIELGSAFNFYTISCNWVAQKNAEIDLITLAKSQFGYDAKYAHLAKLYTYPYAALEITDENGNVTLLKIEDTSGSLALQTSVNIAFPWVNIDGRISGVGGNISKTLTFRNVNSHTFSFNGRWYETLTQWQIPTFAITQAASTFNDFSTHFDRAQSALAAANTNANALEANATANTNALADNATANTNALADNSAARLNIADQRSLAAELLGLNNTLIRDSAELNIDKVSDDWDSDYVFNVAGNWIANDQAVISTALNGAQAVLNGAAIGGIAGLSGGAIGAVAGAAGGAINAVPSAIVSAASVPLTITNNSNLATLTQNLGNEKTNHAITNMRGQRDLQTQFNRDTNTVENTRAINIAERNKTTGDAIANRNKATSDANANRDKTTGDSIAARDLSTANSAIANQINQAALNEPYIFGEFANGDTSTTRPLAMLANVITQNKDAIEKTGDYFLRYGYRYNKYIDFEKFNLMPKFTYWKCSDVWVYGLDMADEHMDEIRFFLMGGVTVWSAPEYIGTTSIYENV